MPLRLGFDRALLIAMIARVRWRLLSVLSGRTWGSIKPEPFSFFLFCFFLVHQSVTSGKHSSIQAFKPMISSAVLG